MQLGFDTEDLRYAKAALILYSMYRSRENNSSLMGKETWSRCNAYLRSASIKSSTMPEFVQNFCKKAGVMAIKPSTLATDGLINLGTDLIRVEGVLNYRLEIMEDNDLLEVFGNESQYIVMLVRERLQREKEGLKYEDTI